MIEAADSFTAHRLPLALAGLKLSGRNPLDT